MSAFFPLSTFEDRVKVLYSYDGAGNRLTEIWKDAQNLTVESFNYAYNPGNYLASKGQESFNTGSYGQMTSRTEAGVTTTYAYNPMRMMKEASEAGVTLAKYEYDALGRRIISWLDDEWRTVSLWSGNDSIYEIRQEWTTPPPNPPAETITRYIAVNGQYLAKLVSGPNAMQPFFHHTDIVGTVRAVTDISGAVVARYAYEPFGSLTTASGLVDGELHRFTGKPSDLETSLSYFNARYYDPALGRFTSSDPARDGLNWYQYCNGNPIIFKDNDGKKKIFVVEPSPIGTKAHRAIEKEFLSWYGEGSVQYEETCGSGIFDVAIKSDEVWHLYEIKPLRYTLGYRHKDMQNQIGRYVLALAGRDNQYILGNCLSSNSEMKEKIKTIKFDEYKQGAYIDIFVDASRPGEVFYLIDDGEDTTVEVPKWVTKLVKELPWIVCTIGSFIVGSMFGFGSGLVPQF